MKKIIKIASVLILAVIACAVFLCGCKKPTVDETEIKITNKTSVLYQGDEYKFEATYKENVTITWSSSDESILSIDQNGNAIAKKGGNVTVKAESENKSDSAEITVSAIKTPLITGEDKINIYVGDSYKPEYKVIYDGQAVENIDVFLSVEEGSENVLSIENGTITALTVGVGYVNVKTDYRFYDVTKRIEITVLEATYIELSESDVILYTLATEDKKTETTISATYYEKGKPIDGINIVFKSEDSSVVSCENGKIVALRAGKTVVRAEYKDLYAECSVVVEKTKIAFDDIIECEAGKEITLPKKGIDDFDLTNVTEIKIDSINVYDSENRVIDKNKYEGSSEEKIAQIITDKAEYYVSIIAYGDHVFEKNGDKRVCRICGMEKYEIGRFFTDSVLTEEKTDDYEKVYCIKATNAGEKPVIESINLSSYTEVRFKLKRTAGCLCLDDSWQYFLNSGDEFIEFVMTKNAAGDGWSVAYSGKVMNVKGNSLSVMFSELYFYEYNTEVYVTELVGIKDKNYVAPTFVAERFFTNSSLTNESVDGYEKVYRIKSTAAGDKPAIESINLGPYTEVRFKMKRNNGTICFDADNRWDYCTNAGNEWYEFVMTKNTDKGGFDLSFKVNKDNTEYEKTMFKSGYYLGNIFNIEFYDDIADVCITELMGTKDENYVASTLVSEKFFTNSTLTDEKVAGYEKVYMIKATAAGEKPAIEAVNLAEYKEIRFKLKRTAGCLCLDDNWKFFLNSGTEYIDFVMTKNAAGDGWSIAYNDKVMEASGNVLSEIFAELYFYEANTELYVTELVGIKG